MIRFIDQINGKDSETIYNEVKSLRNHLKWIKKQQKSDENRREIKKIYQKIDELQFVPEYLLLIIDRPSDYWKAFECLKFNGKKYTKYKRLLGTPGGIKTNTIVFLAEHTSDGRPLRDEIFRKIENGRDPEKAMVPAKLEAYRALTCSASTPVSDPKGVLVVPDCETSFKSDYVLLDDSAPGEPVMTTIHAGDVGLVDSDGYGLISYDLAEKWSHEIHEDETVGGFCIRNSFCKGMLFTFPFEEFSEEVAGSDTVTDIWGHEQDIHKVDIILTGSMLKLWDSYSSIEDYLSNCRQNGYTFSVTKTSELEEHESRELNYQFIQSYDLTEDQIDALITPTVEDIAGAMGGDPVKSILFLKGEAQDESTFATSDDDFAKALMIDDSIVNDKYVRGRISQLIRRKADRAKLGRIRVRGDYMVVSGDPYSLCQSMFHLPVTGLLKSGEVYSTYWDERDVSEIVCFRAPMTCHNNIRKMSVNSFSDTRRWYRFMKNVLVTNSWDMLSHALNGMDKDGDLCLTTDNQVLLSATKNDLPISCVQKKSEKKIVCDEDLVKSNIDTFGNDIGAITNRATSMYDVRAKFVNGSEDYKILTYRIMCCQLLQQNEIDRAKGIISNPMPKYWYDRNAAAKEDERIGSDINQRLVADKKPRFMNYRYSQQMAEYNSYMSKTEAYAERQFGKTIKEILQSDGWTEEEDNFVHWYYRKLPVGVFSCTMNQICAAVENKISVLKDEWKRASGEFDYTIYMSDIEYSKSDYRNICAIIDRYKRELELCTINGKRDHLDIDDMSVQKENVVEALRRECFCVCSDKKMLCNILIEATYGRSRSYQFAWAVCGDAIIENLLSKHDSVYRYIKKDPCGEIEYGGDRYSVIEGGVIDDFGNYSE